MGLLSGASLRLDFLRDEDDTGLWTEAVEALLWSRLCVPILEGRGDAQREEWEEREALDEGRDEDVGMREE